MTLVVVLDSQGNRIPPRKGGRPGKNSCGFVRYGLMATLSHARVVRKVVLFVAHFVSWGQCFSEMISRGNCLVTAKSDSGFCLVESPNSLFRRDFESGFAPSKVPKAIYLCASIAKANRSR